MGYAVCRDNRMATASVLAAKLQRADKVLLVLLTGAVLSMPCVARAGAQAGLPVAGRAVLQQQIAKAQGELGPMPQFKGEIAKFYAEMGDEPAWLRDGQLTTQGQALVGLFEEAGQKGLHPEDYGNWVALPERLSAARTETQRLRIDVALTTAAMRYVSDLHFGRVTPEAMGFALGAREKHFSLAGFLATDVVHAGNVTKAIAGAEPPFAGYWRMLAALDRLEAIAANTAARKPLPNPKQSVRAGEKYAALPALVEQLRRVGDLPRNASLPADSTAYQGAIVEAVRRFQERHGLASDGILGRATIAALNIPLRVRIEQLELTLERWRWIPQHIALPLVVVNIPEFRFYVIDRNYRWLMVQKVIIGKSYEHKTPVFVAQMRSVIFRPYWNVPLSIERKELVPKLERDHGYMKRNDYEIVTRANRPVNAAMNGSTFAELRSGRLKIRQMPGDKNALGLIKFEFPNSYDVYMHGTPAQELFSRTRRDFSHGCIRVEHPTALAEWVLRDAAGWGPERIQAAMHGRETVTVNLPRPLTVVILYGTAVVTHDGEIRFLADIYGYDAKLKAALARRRPKIAAAP